MRFTLSSVFNGDAIQVEAASYDVASGQPITWGWGYLSLDPRGRVVNNCYGNALGFSILHETPDDADVLSLEGALPGNRTMDVSMSVADDVLTLSSRVGEGYRGSDDRPRTYTRMRRVGLCPRPEAQP